MSRKLDAAIAEALGREVKFVDADFLIDKRLIIPGVWKYFTGDGWTAIPYYSTDGNAMLELDREMRAREWRLHLSRVDKAWRARYIRGEKDAYVRFGDTMPEAVALSAYNSLTDGKEVQP